MSTSSRPPGLLAHLSLGALRTENERRRVAGSIARGEGDTAQLAERLGQPSVRRHEGPLIWLHASRKAQEGALVDLARRILQRNPEAGVLLTGDTPLSNGGTLPERVAHQLVPHDAPRPVRAFLDHWRPDAVLWAGIALRPALIHSVADAGAPLFLIDASAAPDPGRGWRRLARLTAGTLRRFSHVLATDEQAAHALIEAGAPEATVEVSGPLEEEAATLGCNLHERDAIAQILRARPVWLAVAVPEAEEDVVVAAHRTAARLAHRLLLILVPADPARGPALARRLAEEGCSVALRSVEGEPDTGTEVFVADGENDLGLWYRLAPVTYMGGTLDPGGSDGRSPLEPAALGSAILHGPVLGGNAGLYARFAAADAARALNDGAQLGEALSELLSPDKAAARAHAAWRVSTGGAAVNERVLTLLSEVLARSGRG